MKKIHLITYGYFGKGHSKEYVRNFYNRLKDVYNISLYIASKKKIETPEGLNTVYVPIDFNELANHKFKKFGKFNNLFKQLKRQKLTSDYCKYILKNG